MAFIVKVHYWSYLGFLDDLVQEVWQEVDTWEGYVDWKNEPANRGYYSGMLAAFFMLAEIKNQN